MSAATASMTFVYVKAECRYCCELLDATRAAGVDPVVIDIDRERSAVPELLKLTHGRRIVPVRVCGSVVEVAPHGGTEF